MTILLGWRQSETIFNSRVSAFRFDPLSLLKRGPSVHGQSSTCTHRHRQINIELEDLQMGRTLGWFLFWWKMEFQLLHGFKLFQFVHWFQNSFCFCSRMIFYAVCSFLRFRWEFTLGRLEMAKKPISSGQTLILSSGMYVLGAHFYWKVFLFFPLGHWKCHF